MNMSSDLPNHNIINYVKFTDYYRLYLDAEQEESLSGNNTVSSIHGHTEYDVYNYRYPSVCNICSRYYSNEIYRKSWLQWKVRQLNSWLQL